MKQVTGCRGWVTSSNSSSKTCRSPWKRRVWSALWARNLEMAVTTLKGPDVHGPCSAVCAIQAVALRINFCVFESSGLPHGWAYTSWAMLSSVYWTLVRPWFCLVSNDAMDLYKFMNGIWWLYVGVLFAKRYGRIRQTATMHRRWVLDVATECDHFSSGIITRLFCLVANFNAY